MTFSELSDMQDEMVEDPLALVADDFILFLLHFCVNCHRVRDEHLDGKCLFGPTHHKPAGLRAAIRYKRWVQTWKSGGSGPPDRSFWEETI